MLATINARAADVSDTVFAASRQVWLAGLGAAVVTREWASNGAGTMFRNLVREGTAVESRAFRYVGDSLDSSFARATTLWTRARSTAKAYTENAAALVRGALAEKPARKAKPAATKRKPAPARKANATARRGKRSTASAKRA
jgi:hypothetical protein